MIIVKIYGGLGNQLFQYAAAKSLADFHKVQMKVDDSYFNESQLRSFDLQKFNASELLPASEAEIKELKAENQLQRIWQYLTPLKNRTYYKELFFHYNKSFFKLGNKVYLKGYWQTEKYFITINETIRKEFALPYCEIKNVLDVGNSIKSETAASIHIRRGDYKNPEAEKFHGLLPLEYYNRAMEILKEKEPSIKFYLFSDDMAWARQNFTDSNITFVSGNLSKTNLEDFYLMSICKHNIIANSSFSWWAAWLNNNNNKIVIAPKKWFNKAKHNTRDLFPQNWIKI